MLELLAFAVVGLALGAPFIVPLIWGHTQSSQASAPSAQDCRGEPASGGPTHEPSRAHRSVGSQSATQLW